MKTITSVLEKNSRILLILLVFIAASVVAFVTGYFFGLPRIPRCQFAPDVIVGNGEYDSDTGYWTEYDCVSEQAFTDRNYVNRKSGD